MRNRFYAGLSRGGCFSLAALFVLSAAPSASSGTGESSLTDLIRKVQVFYDGTTDWVADFNQTTRIAGFETEITARGKLYIKKPGKMRWDYLEPNRNQVVVNEGKLWIHTPEQQQVIVSPFSSVTDSQLPLHFLSGVGRLDREFTPAWAVPQHPGPETPRAVTLTPRVRDSGLSRLEITVDPVENFITRLVLIEDNGNRSRLDFTNVNTNTGLKDRFFVLTPPKGTVVIEAPGVKP